MDKLKSDAVSIWNTAVRSMLPSEAVRRALKDFSPCGGRIILIAIGKAAWEMASAASEELGGRIACGCAAVKYGHSRGAFSDPNIEIYEGGHPLPDENCIAAGKRILEMTDSLSPYDTVLFLVSGGGSALFEVPLPGISLKDIENLNREMLASGAGIVEINTLRKRFSSVKGGRFALHCAPSSVCQITLSDVIGNRMDTIASGPAVPDMTTCAEAAAIIKRYGIKLPDIMKEYLKTETPKELSNVRTVICGSSAELCLAAKKAAESLGYNAFIISSKVECEARELGLMAGAVSRDIEAEISDFKKPCAVIIGGETVVHIKGKGLGGGNQEAALSAALAISGLKNIVIAAGGSDGTDGPTDAAGGIICGETCEKITSAGCDPLSMLEDNNSYEALKCADALFVTGPTGTNVNDLMLIMAD